MSEPDHEHGSDEYVEIEIDNTGRPCFGCYFGELFASFTDAELATIPVDTNASAEDIEFARRFGASMAHVVDSVVRLAFEAAGDQSDEVLRAFRIRLDRAVQLNDMPAGSLLN